jgi:hypothetical protein
MLTLIYQVSAALMIIGLAIESEKTARTETATLLIMSFIPVLNTLILLCSAYLIIKEHD